VSFAGERGVRHSVEVTADTLYEAAATALSIFKQSEWADVIGPNTELPVVAVDGTSQTRLFDIVVPRCPQECRLRASKGGLATAIGSTLPSATESSIRSG
jgi:hypothetical protein